jgi:hypothetical protein
MARRKHAAQAHELTPESQDSMPATPEIPTAIPVTPEPQAADQTSREPGDDPEKSWVKRASIIIDPEAGVKFHFDYQHHRAIITFNEKPSAELLAVAKPILKEAGYHWDANSEPAGWARKIQYQSRGDDRTAAKKAFHEVANAIRQHKGLPMRSFGESVPF